MVRIPSEYQEVEYLESTGSQWIKTDISSRFSITAESIIEFISATDTYTVGVLDGNFRLGLNGHYGLNTQTGYGGSYYYGANGYPIQLKTKYKYKTVVEPNNQQVFLNDELVKSYTISQNVSSLSGVKIGIFGRCKGDTADLLCKDRIYSLILSDGGETLGNFIPCYRKSDNKPGMYDTVSKTFFTNSGTGTFLVGNDVNYSNTNLLEVRRRILLNTPHVESMSGNPAIFTTDMAANLKECKIRFSPVQAGEGTPSPENVRAISGWDGVSVTKASKNLIDFNTATYIYHAWVNNGVIKPTASYNLYSFKIPQNTILTLSRNKDTNSVGCVCAISTEDAAVGRSYSVGFPTITNRIYYTFNSGDCNYLWFCIVSSADISIYEWQLEVGNNRTSYDSPSSTSISIPFPQTIFGGYVDLIKGEVVEEWIKKTLVGSEIYNTGKAYRGTNCTNAYANITPKAYGNHATSRAISDSMDKVNTSIWASADSYPNAFTINNGVQLHICLPNSLTGIESSDTDAQCGNKFKAFIQNNNINFAYLLATPNVYPLTPQTIKTLRGLNNLYSDANGNIEVKFWSHEQYQTLSGEYEITDDNYLLTTNDGYVIDF